MTKKEYVRRLSEKTGIKERTLYSRIVEKGWSEEKAITTPIKTFGKNNVQIGFKNNKLTVIEFVGTNKDHKSVVKCQCECGNIIRTLYASVKSGNTKSCGCQLTESVHNRSDYHGKTHERVYQSWVAMKLRCYNKNSSKYKNYGGRGITMCDEWFNDFQAFYKWAVDNGYRSNLTIDRIDVNGNYDPSNCRWVDYKTQAWNKTNTIKIAFMDNQYTLKDIADITGESVRYIRGKYNNNILIRFLEEHKHDFHRLRSIQP